jgi:uncharacterized protein
VKSSEADILVVPGLDGSPTGHWQQRIVEKLTTARFVLQADWRLPVLSEAVAAVDALVMAADRPLVFITHSVGGLLLAHAILALAPDQLSKIRGGFLVAPPGEDFITKVSGIDPAFASTPRLPLPFPSILVASNTDPFASLEQSADLALAWGSQFVEAGDAGHINIASGHGPWPEGIMRFAGFLSRL